VGRRVHGHNLYQIWRIYMERRPVALSPDEQTLYDMGFHSLRPATSSLS